MKKSVKKCISSNLRDYRDKASLVVKEVGTTKKKREGGRLRIYTLCLFGIPLLKTGKVGSDGWNSRSGANGTHSIGSGRVN